MIYSILIGALAGFLAGHILRGEGYGAIGNIIMGILGGVVGGLLFGLLGFHSSGIIGDLISGTVGAVILVYFFGKKKHGGKSDD
jgi:uncharacterized membrane protein YeaQ/YmgE (transglycosylase-associated protein family)